jgi:hypothetical protein
MLVPNSASARVGSARACSLVPSESLGSGSSALTMPRKEERARLSGPEGRLVDRSSARSTAVGKHRGVCAWWFVDGDGADHG